MRAAYGARTAHGVFTRVAQRLLAPAAAVWRNWAINASDKRSLIAYDHWPGSASRNRSSSGEAVPPARADCLVTRSKVLGELMTADVVELASRPARQARSGPGCLPPRSRGRVGHSRRTEGAGGPAAGAQPRRRGGAAGQLRHANRGRSAHEHTVAAMLAGLSTRRYGAGLEPVGTEAQVSASVTSQSAVSRRFVNTTAERLAAFRGADLSGQRWLICFLDGFDFAGHTMVGALGVTADGVKVPLGVVKGSTENATVVRRLVTDLRDRGVDAAGGIRRRRPPRGRAGRSPAGGLPWRSRWSPPPPPAAP